MWSRQELNETMMFNHEETIEQFEKALEVSDHNAAVDIFCVANDIAKINTNQSDYILTRICRVINKPVSALFIIKLLDYLDDKCRTNTQYDSIKLLPCYIDLWNKSHLINNWEDVKIKIKALVFFKPCLNMAILYALKNSSSPALDQLLKEKKLEMSEMGTKYTVLQTIIAEVSSSFYSSSDYKELHYHLDMLFDIIKKLTVYNNKYLVEHDNYGFNSDVNYSLKNLSKALDKKLAKYNENPSKDILKNKVNEIIKFVNQEMKNIYFANARLLFFSQESLYSQLPKDVLGEIATNINKIESDNCLAC